VNRIQGAVQPWLPSKLDPVFIRGFLGSMLTSHQPNAHDGLKLVALVSSG